MKRTKSYRPAMEPLGDRQLLASSLTASFEFTDGLGVLHIEGTDQADTVLVRQTNGAISVDGAKVSGLNGLYDAVLASYVNVIDVNTLGGDDRIYVNSETAYWQQPIGAIIFVDAGTGNDLVHGAAGSNFINGGEGNDVLWGNASMDIVVGGVGTDWLYGLGGDDRLEGGDDNDVLNGGFGNDILRGGIGVDYLFGEAGDDYLFFDAWDYWYGGWDFGLDPNDQAIYNGTEADIIAATYEQVNHTRFLNNVINTVNAAVADYAEYSGGSVFNATSGVSALLGANEGAWDVIRRLETDRGFGPTGYYFQNLTPG